jgi:hypothetical protein
LVKDGLEILGYPSSGRIESEIFGLRQKPKKNNAEKRITASATKKEYEALE